jgi:regulator of protease activity HflC (stomatin/prohibitin superfamily)
VVFGKRTVKEGEVCAIWNLKGEHKLISGPHRQWIFMSDVRFLSRYTADQSEYLVVKHRTGTKEHLRGPIVLYCDPVHHISIEVEKGIALENFEALVVYREVGSRTEGASAKGTAADSSESAVRRRLIRGPTLFFPDASEWVHNFSWHGSRKENTAAVEDVMHGVKYPHQIKFTKLNLTPTQLYVDVKDARTADDAQLTISLMVFYHMVDLELMLDTSQDPVGDFVNALSADVMSFAANKSYESVLSRTSSMSELATFPILCARAKSIGMHVEKVVYRGLKTSSHLQEMHNKSVANASKLRFEALESEQRERRLDLETLHAAEREKASLAAASLAADQARADAEKDHEQKLRHWRATQESDNELLRMRHAQELEFLAQLGQSGVDLTQYLVAKEAARPDAHYRIDGTASNLAKLHIVAEGGDEKKKVGVRSLFG